MVCRLEEFEAVYGQAQGQLDSPLPCALLPFMFTLKGMDASHLRLVATDFHSNTWQAVRNVEQLEKVKTELHFEGSMIDFLAFLRDSFSSDCVHILLQGSSSALGAAASAQIVAQKSKAAAKIRFPLTKFGSPWARDAMGLMVADLFQLFRNQSLALSAERKRATGLAAALAAQREHADDSFHEDCGMSTYTSKRRKLSSSQFASTST